VLRKNLPYAGGVVALLTAADDVRARPARPVHYDRLRAYRQRKGLTARSIVSGNYEVYDFELDGRIERGLLVADHVAMRILGGDLVGNMALQVGRNQELFGDMAFETSNIDASNFKLLELEPGPETELSADIRFSFMFSPAERDLTMDINVTKIGEEALDRFLQLLDPEGKDKNIGDYRDYLGLGVVDINGMSMWVRYENLNVDLDYEMIVKPWRPLAREVKRRFAIGDMLNVHVQPLVQRYVAPYLGWSDAS
jgi:hypothetical protein